jgi:GNAT superfamily N-acetyltransferase
MGSPKNVGHLKPVSASPDSRESNEGLRLDTIEGDTQMQQFSKLLDVGFGVKSPGRVLDDLPIWDEKVGPGAESVLRIGVWDGTALVSCAGVRLANLRVPTGSLEVALIGAVATASSHRGAGLASRTVSLAVEWARERGAAMALLWGAETALYERLGFELCGMQTRVPLSELELGPAIRDFSSITLGRGWLPSLMGGLRMRGSGLRLSDKDESWIEAHRGVDWYWLGDPEAPQAYAAIGRGIDLQGLVHEWGGDSHEALKNLLQLVRMEHTEAQLLTSPNLLAAWQLGAVQAPTEFLCMARSLDVVKLTHGFGIKLPAGDPFLTTPNVAVCRKLFGPSENALPLWIWGLDAV